MRQSRAESISWETVEEVTRGHLGRVMTTCPLCSEHRRAHNRRSKVLAVNLIEPEFAVYFCNHCGESGFVHPDKPSRPINPIERQCLLDEAKRHAEESKSARMRSALAIWNDAQLFPAVQRMITCVIHAELAIGSMSFSLIASSTIIRAVHSAMSVCRAWSLWCTTSRLTLQPPSIARR